MLRPPGNCQLRSFLSGARGSSRREAENGQVLDLSQTAPSSNWQSWIGERKVLKFKTWSWKYTNPGLSRENRQSGDILSHSSVSA